MDNKKITLVYNHSIKHFVGQCNAIAAEIEKKGYEAEVFTNGELIMRKKLPEGRKCIFYDKDIPLGMRFELQGVRLFNSIGAIEACGDKCRSYELLKELPQPKTEIYPKTFFADEDFFAMYSQFIADELGLPVVAKLADGSQGREVFLLETVESITDFQRKYYAHAHLYQEFIAESRGKDIRIFVIGDEVYASMLRYNPNDFRSNIAIGGTAEKYEINNEIKDICISATRLMGLDFAGLDILLGKDGKPYICEVNSNALFTALSQVCQVNISEGIASHVIDTKTDFFNDVGLFL
ncbi:MAG: RimK family alpha-L-glutamate ligase [Clostridia bacterium]|nr:RimK family alpha-L-glutamate ligase [Clostridia bacterium]